MKPDISRVGFDYIPIYFTVATRFWLGRYGNGLCVHIPFICVPTFSTLVLRYDYLLTFLPLRTTVLYSIQHRYCSLNGDIAMRREISVSSNCSWYVMDENGTQVMSELGVSICSSYNNGTDCESITSDYNLRWAKAIPGLSSGVFKGQEWLHVSVICTSFQVPIA